MIRIFSTLVGYAALIFVSVPRFVAAPQPAPERISFELSQSHAFIQVKVNGKGPYTFLLDTGTGGTVLSREVVREVDAEQATHGRAVGVGEGMMDSLVLHNIRLEIGGYRFHPDLVYGLPLEPMKRTEGRTVDGIIGYDFFKENIIEVDYQKQQLTLLHGSVGLPREEVVPPPHWYSGTTRISLAVIGDKIVLCSRVSWPAWW